MLLTQNQLLKNFAYVAAHDLKTPIRTIGNFANLFQIDYSDVVQEDHKKWLSFIVEDSNRLSNMVENILDFSNIKTNPADRKKLILMKL